MIDTNDIPELIDRYEQRRSEREAKLKDFFDPGGERRFLIVPRVNNKLYTSCRNVQEVIKNNIDYVKKHLKIDLCDDLPYLEPWIGVGVYASAFGSEYLWDTGGAPDTLYRYRSIEEVRDIEPPSLPGSPVMQMVIESIDRMRELTKANIPIALTDTQSAQDTATLVLETTEFLTGCYTDPEVIHGFLDSITRLIVEFSRMQIAHIGDDLVACPGHGFHGLPFLSGVGVSDDNMVFSSPDLNEQFSFPQNRKLGEELGGIAIHSCGDWTPTMERIHSIDGLYMIDFALVGHHTDATPCDASRVSEAIRDDRLILKARVGAEFDIAAAQLKQIAGTANRIILEFPSTGNTSEDAELYKRYTDTLGSYY